MKIAVTHCVDDRISITEALFVEDSEIKEFVKDWMEDEDGLREPVPPIVTSWDGKSKFIATVLADDLEGCQLVFIGGQFDSEVLADEAAEVLVDKLREEGEIEDHHECQSWGLPIRSRQSEGRYDAMFRDD